LPPKGIFHLSDQEDEWKKALMHKETLYRERAGVPNRAPLAAWLLFGILSLDDTHRQFPLFSDPWDTSLKSK
jgi:hypothetical protein